MDGTDQRDDHVGAIGVGKTDAGRTRQNHTLHLDAPFATQNETGTEDVGNSTSSVPAPRENLSLVEVYSSAGSSPSASRSGVPAKICSAIRPEFCRIAVSILAVMSGLPFKNAFEFSRPWPRRWLS